jgi:glycerophosphoryl diester phosphodiesterase
VVRDLAAFLDDQPGGTEVVVQSFDFAAMKELKTRVPDVPVGLLGRPARANLPALATWADQVNPSHRAVDRDYVGLLHDLGLECRVWTVDRSHAMRRAVRLGVDGVITNRPDAFGRLLSGSSRFGVPVPG